MKEIKLREVIRKQLIKRLIEAPESFTSRVGSAVSSKLGGGRSELNRGLKKVDVSKVSKLPRSQKINLLTALLQNVGITSADFDSIKAKVSRDLSKASAETTDESVNEAVPGRVDMRMGQFTDEFKSKMKGKSAQQQQELVINLVSGLDIKGNDATFIAKLKKALK
jgi:hypothetical protein|tara:strand:+ start:1640 stop:2137 length:498 start_codon:yes stop_codon:yes gene_type:complete